MNEDKNKGLLIVLMAGLMMVLKFYTAGAIFFLIGSYKLIKYWQHPQRKVLDRLKMDAELAGAFIPASYKCQERLVKLYMRLHQSERRYPQLIEQYADMIDKFWENVADKVEPRDWMVTIEMVMRNWPTIDSPGRGNLRQSLDEAQRMADHLKKAKEQAMA